MGKLEDGSIEVDSAYMANRLAIASGYNRELDELSDGLSLDEKPTLAANNEIGFYNKSLSDFALTPEAQRSKLRYLNDTAEPSWYSEDWQPPKSWLDSGMTPPGRYQEKVIVIGSERAQLIEMVLGGITKGINFRQLRSQPGLEKFRLDAASNANVSETLRISKAEASFILEALTRSSELMGAEVSDQAA